MMKTKEEKILNLLNKSKFKKEEIIRMDRETQSYQDGWNDSIDIVIIKLKQYKLI